MSCAGRDAEARGAAEESLVAAEWSPKQQPKKKKKHQQRSSADRTREANFRLARRHPRRSKRIDLQQPRKRDAACDR